MDALCHGKQEFFASFPIDMQPLGSNSSALLLGPTSHWTKLRENTGERMRMGSLSFRIFHVLAVPQRWTFFASPPRPRQKG